MIGKVVDASALAALARGHLEATGWLQTAHATATSLYVPALAVSEVLFLRPDAADDLEDIGIHPSIVVKDMTAAERVAVEQLLAKAGGGSGGVFDVLAGHVVHVATVMTLAEVPRRC